jgi:probable rRNA maturation factor
VSRAGRSPRRTGASPVAAAEGAVGETLRMLRCGRLSAGVVVVDAPESARLNRLYMRRKGPAEVLSFAQPPLEPGGSLGEVVLCPAHIRRKASRLGYGWRRRLLELSVHGTLHLMGWHHSGPLAGRAMFAVQAAVLARMGGR